MWRRWGTPQNFFLAFIDELEKQHLLKNLLNWANKNQIAGDTIILQMCTINDNYMMYGSWDMKHEEQDFLSFWTIFCLFTPLTTPKMKNLKTWKKCLEISSFYTSVLKIMIIATLFLRYSTWSMQLLFFIFGCFLPFTPP